MDKELIRKIIEATSQLKGSKFTKATRCTTLGSFTFTDSNKIKYAIHSESFFRFVKDDQILFTQHDIFYEHEFSTKELDYKKGERINDFIGETQFDLISSKIAKLKLIVLDVKVNEFGDLTVIFNEGYKFDFYVGGSRNISESYRFFKVNSKEPHLVVYYNEIDNDI